MSQQLLLGEESVRSGFFTGRWFDYHENRYRLLFSNTTAPYIYALVVFFITISAKNVAIIVGRLIQLLGETSRSAIHERQLDAIRRPTPRTPLIPTYGSTTYRSTDNIDSDAGEAGEAANPIVNREASRASQDEEPTRHTADASHKFPSGTRDVMQLTWKYILNKDNPHKTWTILCCILLLCFQVGVFVLGYQANGLLESGKAALWYSENCGLWEFPTSDATEEEATRSDVILRQKEARAGEYAKYCYDPVKQPLPVYCNFFAHRNISFEETRPYTCPFPEKSICAGSQVVRFDTGKVPASHLGINQATSYRFQRIATCAPLNVEEPYVKKTEENGTRVYRYYYGQENDADNDEDYLFDTTGDPFNWTVPTYDASVFMTGPASRSFWTPIDDLKPGDSQTLTLIFIRPLQVYYLAPSADPIFPTDRTIKFDDNDRWYVKLDPKAGVLSCVEETNLCGPSGEPCWPASHHNGPILDPGYWLMKLALKNTNIYHSISLRLGTALVAQEMLSQQISLPLDDDHWMTEARRLFSTSLASAQFNAWSIGSGEGYRHVKDYGWVDQTPDEAKEAGGLCNLLRFKSTGYTDIDMLSMILLLILPWPLTALLSMRWTTFRSAFPRGNAQHGQGSATDAGTAGHGHTEQTAAAEATGESVSDDTAGNSTANGADHTANGSEAARQRVRSGRSDDVSHTNGVGQSSQISKKAMTTEDERLLIEVVGLPLWNAIIWVAKVCGVMIDGSFRLLSMCRKTD